MLTARKRSTANRGVRFDTVSAMGCIVGGVGGRVTDDEEDEDVALSASSTA